MSKFAVIAAAVGATFAVGSAQAVFLSVDNFDSPDVLMFDTSAGASVSMMAGPSGMAASVGAQYSDSTRTIVHNWTVPGSPANTNGTRTNVSIGNEAFPGGSLAMNNVSGFNSVVDVSWNLAPGFVPLSGPVSFFFAVVNSDTVNKYLSYSVDGGTTFTSIGTYNTAINTPTVDPFAVTMSAADKVALNAGGVLTLRITGDEAWDFAIDSFGFQIPEPATLALTGLALIGAGVASRRRKV